MSRNSPENSPRFRNVDDEGPNEAKRLLSQYLYSLSKLERPSNGSIEVEVRLGTSQERIDFQNQHSGKEFVPGER